MDLTSLGLGVLRAGIAALLFFRHGLPKLMGFADMAHSFPDPLGAGTTISLILAIFAEVFCPVFIFIGLYTRIFVVPILIVMLVAFFVIHGEDPFVKKELSLLFALPLFALLCTGAGKFSLDGLLRGK